jgi:hypothetical protein
MQQPSFPIEHHRAGFAWRSRLRAACIHLALSALRATLVGLLVFALWYPYPYGQLSGGHELFRLVVSVDVVLGPLITFAIFNTAKPRRELRRDLCVVALLQLAGLAYGLWTVQLARPVHLVFELDRFRVVHRADIPVDVPQKAPPGIELAPWNGPTLLSLRPFRSPQESFDLTMAALQGVPLAAQPHLWQDYAAARPQVLRAARPIAQLKSRFPHAAADIDAALRKAGRDPATAAYLPLISRKAESWTVLIDSRTADVLAFLPLDSF